MAVLFFLYSVDILVDSRLRLSLVVKGPVMPDGPTQVVKHAIPGTWHYSLGYDLFVIYRHSDNIGVIMQLIYARRFLIQRGTNVGKV